MPAQFPASCVALLLVDNDARVPTAAQAVRLLHHDYARTLARLRKAASEHAEREGIAFPIGTCFVHRVHRRGRPPLQPQRTPLFLSRPCLTGCLGLELISEPVHLHK